MRIIAPLLLGLLSINVNAQKLKAYFNYATFNSTETPYLETYLSIQSNTVAYKTIETGKFQAELEIVQLLKNESGEIAAFKKYKLSSPLVSDSMFTDFIDQQRFSLKNGKYKLEIEIVDVNNNEGEKSILSQEIDVSFNEKIAISDIELVDNYEKTKKVGQFTKAGLNMYPQIFNYYPSEMAELIFYAEIYNTDKELSEDGMFLLSCYIETKSDERPLTEYYKISREQVNGIMPIFKQFNISNLSSGNYNLVIEIKNKENVLLKQKKVFFQRSNPFANMSMAEVSHDILQNTFVRYFDNPDTLAEHIQSLRPISKNSEQMLIDNKFNPKLSNQKMEEMKRFFYSFWYNRNQIDPENAWNDYLTEVKKVNKAFSSRIRKGYQTDRGRIYLKYGPPNDITDRPNEPSAYPYQIWHYFKAGKYNNRRFIFYNPANITNDYELLHSDVRGEIQNYKWDLFLNKRSITNQGVDHLYAPTHYGGNARDFYNNPR